MRRAVSNTLVVAVALVLAFPSAAQAGGQRRVRRGAGAGSTPATPVRSDEGIQQALRAAPSGGLVVLPQGTYRTLIVIDRPLHVVGSPAGTVLQAAGLGRPAIEILYGVVGVVVEGVRLEGADDAALLGDGGNDRLVLRGLVVTGARGDGARVAGGDDVVVDRCTFDANGGSGLDLGGKRARATRLLVRGNVGAGVMLRGEDASVADSQFDGGGEGVVLAGLRDGALRDAFRGVRVAGRMAPAADTCAFQRNDVRAVVNAFVCDLGSTYGRVEDNRVAGCTGDAVRLLGTWHTVSGNTLSGIGGDGVVGAGSSLRVENNRVDAPRGDGVSILGDGNMVDSNAVTAPGGVALDVAGDGNVVALNACDRAGGDAIQVAGAMNRLVSNTVGAAGGEGIRLAGNANTVQGNTVRGTAGNGLHVAGGSANVLESNRLLACGGAGFLDEGSGTVLLTNRVD